MRKNWIIIFTLCTLADCRQPAPRREYVENLLLWPDWACAPQFPVVLQQYDPRHYCGEDAPNDYYYDATIFPLPEKAEKDESADICIPSAEENLRKDGLRHFFANAVKDRYSFPRDVPKIRALRRRADCVAEEIEKRKTVLISRAGVYSCCFYDRKNERSCVQADEYKDSCECSLFIQYRGGEKQFDRDAKKIEETTCKLEE